MLLGFIVMNYISKSETEPSSNVSSVESVSVKEKEKSNVVPIVVERKNKVYKITENGIEGIARLGEPLSTVTVPSALQRKEQVILESMEGEEYRIHTIQILDNKRILVEIREYENRIDEILIYSEQFKTHKGAGVGIELDSLLPIYPSAKISHAMVEESERFFCSSWKKYTVFTK